MTHSPEDSSSSPSSLDEARREAMTRKYHTDSADWLGLTRYGVTDCGDLISFYDEDGAFRIMEETENGMITAAPDQVELLAAAILRSHEE